MSEKKEDKDVKAEDLKLATAESQQKKRDALDKETAKEAAKAAKDAGAGPGFVIVHEMVGPFTRGERVTREKLEAWAKESGGGMERLIALNAIAEVED